MFHKLLDLPFSLVRCGLWKLFYRSRLQLPDVTKKFFAKGVEVNLRRGGRLVFRKGRVVCRRYVNFNVTGGLLEVGEHCFFNRGTSLNVRGNLVIGAGTMFGENVLLYDHDHVRGENVSADACTVSDITIGKNVWVGAGTIILRGSILEDDCTIGAGAVVKGRVPRGATLINSRNARFLGE